MTDTRNVIDPFKYWTEEAIRADLRTKHNNFSVLISNQFNDFNIGSVVRNANAFCATKVIVYGRKQYDRRGTVGTHLYMDMQHVKFVEDLDLSDSVVIGFDNVPNSEPLETFVWPEQHVTMVFGQEQVGLSEELLALCHKVLYIRQYGSVRSLNVGCASAIAMYDYCTKGVKNVPDLCGLSS